MAHSLVDMLWNRPWNRVQMAQLRQMFCTNLALFQDIRLVLEWRIFLDCLRTMLTSAEQVCWFNSHFS